MQSSNILSIDISSPSLTLEFSDSHTLFSDIGTSHTVARSSFVQLRDTVVREGLPEWRDPYVVWQTRVESSSGEGGNAEDDEAL